MKFVFFRQFFDFRSILQKTRVKMKKNTAELLFLVSSAMFWYASHLCSIKTDSVLFFLINHFLENRKLRKTSLKFWQSEPMNTFNTCLPPILEELPCSQCHNLLACDQPDPKYNFSSKIRHFDPFWRDGPLKLLILEVFFSQRSRLESSTHIEIV